MKKKLLFNLLLLLVSAGTLIASTTATPGAIEHVQIKKEFTRSIKKEYPITANGSVGLINRHGKVEVKTWNENRVKAEVTITVVADSEENANKVFDRIEVDFSNGSDYVQGETTIAPEKKSWSWWGKSGNSKYTIDYVVFMPATCDLNLANKYGHSSVEALTGDAKVEVKYGDVRMDGVENDLDLIIGYGNATVSKSKDAKINIKYGKLRMGETRDLNIESKYSKVYLDKGVDVESLSKYDTYRIGEIRELQNNGKYDDYEIDYADMAHVTSRYSDFEITKLSNRGDFNVEYGSIAVGLEKGFAKLEVKSRYTNVKIGVSPSSQYELDVVTNYAGIRHPDRLDIHRQIEERSRHEIKGYAGGEGGNNLIHIRADYGSVKIME